MPTSSLHHWLTPLFGAMIFAITDALGLVLFQGSPSIWIPIISTMVFQAIGIAFLYGSLWQRVKEHSAVMEKIEARFLRVETTMTAVTVAAATAAASAAATAASTAIREHRNG